MGLSPSSDSSSPRPQLMNGEENLQTEMRKRKRMVSNRESARRSRMRKQKLLDDLTSQMSNLRAENSHILADINLVTHLYLNMESDNSVLRAQMSELNHRLHALNDIIIACSSGPPADYDHRMMIDAGSDHDEFLNPWSLILVNQPIIMASPNVLMY